MNRMRYLVLVRVLCLLLTASSRAEFADVLDVEEDAAVNIVFTKLDVNDTELNLSWKTTNNADHDVWICDRLSPGDFFEWFLDTDDETLVIRRRFHLPQGQGWEHLPRGSYIRLRPGQETVDSISLNVPVREHIHFAPVLGHGQSATRLALEIGYYDEDLPGLILEIVEMAELLNCDTSLHSPASPAMDPYDKTEELSRRFFPGVFVARVFSLESFTFFHDSVTSGGDEIIIPYLYQTLNGEQVLRIEVDGVSVPLKRDLPSLTGRASKITEAQQSRSVSKTNEDKPRREKG